MYAMLAEHRVLCKELFPEDLGHSKSTGNKWTVMALKILTTKSARSGDHMSQRTNNLPISYSANADLF